MIKNGLFICEHCYEVFETEWTNEEAEAEAVKNGFGDLPEEERAIVCSDCYDDLMGATLQ